MIKAYYGKEITVPGEGICFAASASKAKALIFRSAVDAGFKVRFQDIKVRRSPTYDGCMPDDYRHQFFTMEHAEGHLRPNPKADVAPASGAHVQRVVGCELSNGEKP